MQERMSSLQRESEARLREWQLEQRSRDGARKQLQEALQKAEVEVAVGTKLRGQWPAQIADQLEPPAVSSLMGEVRLLLLFQIDKPNCWLGEVRSLRLFQIDKQNCWLGHEGPRRVMSHKTPSGDLADIFLGASKIVACIFAVGLALQGWDVEDISCMVPPAHWHRSLD
jgi:hypothetical protein